MPVSRLHNIGRASMLAARSAMNVTGENLSNVNTEGYSRRRIVLASDAAAAGAYEGARSFGGGVSIVRYERVRDDFLGRAMLEGRSAYAYSQETYRVLSTLESLFPGGTGSLENVVASFWNAWSDLADNPVDNGVREAVRAAGATLARTLNGTAASLVRYAEDLEADLNTYVDRANELLEEMGRLNHAIQYAETSGSPDLNALDERDRVLNELSSLLPLQVTPAPNGSVRLAVRGHTLVEGRQVNTVTLDTSGSSPRLMVTGTAFDLDLSEDGRIGALLDVAGTDVPQLRARLDQLTEGLVKQVNALHSDPHDDAGNAVAAPAPNFFQYGAGPPESGIHAGTIRLSDEIQADVRLVGTPGYFTSSGDEIAFAIAGLRGTSFAETGGDTAENFIISMKTRLGAGIQQAAAQSTSRAATLDHLDAMVQGASAVSLDEELAMMIQYQQSFAASARVLNAAEEMLDVLMAI